MATKDLNVADLSGLDAQIAILLECKPLPETEVKALAEKVTQIYSLFSDSSPKSQSFIITLFQNTNNL
jgi:hypothetical protein